MFDSVESISNAKNVEDTMNFEKSLLSNQISVLLNEKLETSAMVSRLIREKDQYRDEVKEMADIKYKVEREKTLFTFQTKETINRLNLQIQQLKDKLDVAIEDQRKSEKQCKQLIEEITKMKIRIIKLKNRKGRVD